jgi:hypothetical protein
MQKPAVSSFSPGWLKLPFPSFFFIVTIVASRHRTPNISSSFTSIFSSSLGRSFTCADEVGLPLSVSWLLVGDLQRLVCMSPFLYGTRFSLDRRKRRTFLPYMFYAVHYICKRMTLFGIYAVTLTEGKGALPFLTPFTRFSIYTASHSVLHLFSWTRISSAGRWFFGRGCLVFLLFLLLHRLVARFPGFHGLISQRLF